MTEEEKRVITKEQIKLVRAQYRRLSTEYEAAAGSRGAVSAWGGVGGRSGRISRPTQDRALRAIELEECRREILRWYECIRGTCLRLAAREGKGPNLWRHQYMVGRALQLYVFERAGGDMLAMMLSGPRKLSRQYVSRVMREAVDEVMRDADRAGLFERDRSPEACGAAGNEAGA